MKKTIICLLMVLMIGTLAVSNISLHIPSGEFVSAADKIVINCDYPDGVM